MKKLLIFLFLLYSQFVVAQRVLTGVVSNHNEYHIILAKAEESKISAPSAPQQTAQMAFLSALKTAGIWDLTDVLKVYATNGAPLFSLINWKRPGTFSSSFVGGTIENIFTSDAGITFDASTYIDDGWAPSDGINYLQNSCEQVAYFDNITAGAFPDGSRDASQHKQSITNPLVSANTVISESNEDGANTISDSQFNGTKGLYFWGRTTSGSCFGKKDSGTRIANAINSSGVSTFHSFFGALNTGNVASNKSTRTILLRWSGGLLSTGQEASFKTAWDTYYATLSPPTIRGDIYNVVSWSNLSDFTNVGATASVVSNAIQFSGGAGTYTQTLQLNTPQTAVDKWKISSINKVGTKNSTSFGFGVGVKSTNTNAQHDIVATFNMTSGANAGKCFIVTGENGTYTIQTTSAGAIVFSVNDLISITLERFRNFMTFTAQNITTLTSPIVITFQYNNTLTPFLNNTSKFSMISLGGAFTVSSFVVNSTDLKNCAFAAIGDSKTSNYMASTYYTSWVPDLISSIGYGNRFGGGTDRTVDMLNRVQEVIDFNPSKVIMGGASNDPRTGVSTSTMNSNYDAIVTALTGAGIRVIHTTGFYETSGVDQTALRTHILATYSSSDIIDTLSTVLSLNADGIHPNDAGHATIASTILNSGKL